MLTLEDDSLLHGRMVRTQVHMDMLARTTCLPVSKKKITSGSDRDAQRRESEQGCVADAERVW